MWKVVTSSNLNPPLKLFFYSPILTNNNLLLKIYCENIVATFLKIFSSLYYFSFLSLHFIHMFFFFFFSFFFLVFLLHTLSLSLSPLFYLICLPHSRTFQASSTSKHSSHSPTLYLSFSIIYLFYLFLNLILEGICVKIPKVHFSPHNFPPDLGG